MRIGLLLSLVRSIMRSILDAYRLAVIRAGARNANSVDGLRLLVVEPVAVVQRVLARRVARLAGRLEALERAVDPSVLIARDELRGIPGSVGLAVEATLLVQRVQVRQVGFHLKLVRLAKGHQHATNKQMYKLEFNMGKINHKRAYVFYLSLRYSTWDGQFTPNGLLLDGRRLTQTTIVSSFWEGKSLWHKTGGISS